jgi:cyclic beta-1,2-glucan synthetase
VPASFPAKNGYGLFNKADEYEIRIYGTGLPPAPWSNVIANPNGGFVITESGSSCTWMGNSYFYRLTPWHNDPVRDPCSDCVYLRDDDTGDVWTATPAPIREMSEYVIKHGTGYSIFEHQHDMVHTILRVGMATEDPVKISILTVTNMAATRKRLTITSYVEWVLGVSRDVTQQYIHTSFDKESNSLLGQNFFDQQYADQVAFLAMSGQIRSHTGDRREFIGRNGTSARPAALSKTMLSESVGEMVDPCGALQTVITLEPGESQDVVVLLGARNSLDGARDLIHRYDTPQSATAEIERAIDAWRNRLSTITVHTPEPTFDVMSNHWLLYQALSCRMWGRTALYQSSGAYGFRDQLQDVMAFLYADPAIAREHILRATHRQFVEGDVQHWWHPQSGRGVRTRFSDDLAWLPYTVCQYVQVTGDTAILDEQVPYINMRQLEPHEHEIYELPQDSDQSGSVYDHCIRALKKACTFGSHDLPLIGSGDWNDGFSRVGIEGKGESVWLAWFLIDTIKKTLPLCADRDDTATHAQLTDWMHRYTRAVEAHGWDGNWYRRAYFDDGSPLGSNENTEAKIDSIAQSWSVITGAGDPTRSQIAMQSFEQHLVREDARLIMLLTPPFNTSPHDPGYIKGYLPGVRENGAQYTHAALWAVIAIAMQHKGTRAFELFQMLNPVTHTQDQESTLRYKVEPYVVAADVYTADGHLGRGGWTWYTGSASWMYRVAIEAILGFAKRAETITIDPCIPAAWDGYSIEYRYKSATYTINVQNPSHVEYGVKSVSVDGTDTTDKTIALTDDGKHHTVVLTLG